MGKTYESINGEIQEWITQQQMFFVGTAPRADSGSVNVSPKGLDTLRDLNDQTLAFLDYGGSGVETIAHIRENKRIVIMMCAFDGPAKIYRFHGTGTVITPLDQEFSALADKFDRSELGIRSIIRINVTRISDSCGFGVPLYDYREQRSISPNYIRTRGADYIRPHLESKNLQSIDGLPGISAQEANAWTPPVDDN
jgi:predicted pyridoxine 5'-phosphate oxidase superfamily flavin-nucleotide-binding protein